MSEFQHFFFSSAHQRRHRLQLWEFFVALEFVVIFNVSCYLQFRLRASQQNVANQKWTIKIQKQKPSMWNAVFVPINGHEMHTVLPIFDWFNSILMSFYAILVISAHLQLDNMRTFTTRAMWECSILYVFAFDYASQNIGFVRLWREK